ncbi:hypothetical protein MTF65_19235 [Streptomyces sp. APSN-46.1]|uniref:hypothetical protein n=1 Tax=Streptomyces sp. APSN-46.1 TaxID=2929049 RepID=UPI001FB4B1E3|nr:hypothetical protein [Streptomyces sp. APSN-46.1]MCJ1679436.1 hypothetical protein [Streptomyces sp. APSN-46.1]
MVSMRALLAAGTAASAVSTPPARERACAEAAEGTAGAEGAEGGPETDQAASESEAA